MNKLLDLVLGYLKGRPYWAVIEPFVLVAIGWGTVQLFVYQWLSASSSFKPSAEVFLGSYLSTPVRPQEGGAQVIDSGGAAQP
jgi:hypothetical protein